MVKNKPQYVVLKIYITDTERSREIEIYDRKNNILIYSLGTWKDLAPIPDITLENLGAKIEGENTEAFYWFIRKMLNWKPEERPTVCELQTNECLLEGLSMFKSQQAR